MADQNNWMEFTRFVPGFDFLKNLAPTSLGGAATASNAAASPTGAFQQWLAPTMDEGEVQKRIDELKVVKFWLEQNTRALEASIHALEVQKSTLATLKSMNAGMQQMGQAFADGVAHTAQRSAQAFEQEFGAAAAPQPQASEEAPSSAATEPLPDMQLLQAQAAQWWTALTEQFQTIASKALEDIGSNVAAMQQEPWAGQATGAVSSPTPAETAAAPAAQRSGATAKRSAVRKKPSTAATKKRVSSTASKAKGSAKPKSAPK